jgi:AraC-like DNA-binding protein
MYGAAYGYYLFFYNNRIVLAQRAKAGAAMNALLIRDDMSEYTPYTSANLPVYSFRWRLSSFLNYRAECHWHPDLEFTVVLEGEMTYQVNGQVYPLRAGGGIFVNANRLHFGAAAERAAAASGFSDCVFHCLRFNPSLLCAHPYIEARFVNPLLYDSRFDALCFPAPGNAEDAAGGAEKEWKAQVLERMRTLMELTAKNTHSESPDDSALEIQSRLYDLWAVLFANTANIGEDARTAAKGEDRIIKRMISFIQKHYNEKITLDDIAKAGMVCRNKCCRIFKQTLRESVFDYLLNFRIRQSLRLLGNGSMSVTEAALASGFSSSSYYGEIFKRLLGMSPGEYRRKFRAGEPLPAE